MSARRSGRGRAAILFACAALLTGGCTGTTAQSGMDGMPGMDGMAGMAGLTTVAAPAEAAPTGTGLADTAGGYRLVLGAGTNPFTFHVTGPDGGTVTRYQPDESALVQFDLIRSDLTNYQHLDPVMRQDGTWVVPLPALPAGAYRAYVNFAAPNASAGTPKLYRLSQPFTVPGQAADDTLPPQATTTEVDGYAVTLSGQPVAGRPGTLRVGITSGGRPVAYLQRYLDGYAHLTAFHAGDLAAARLGPAERPTAKADLTSQAWFPEAGTWRVFVEFRTSGPILTAGFTVTVG
jgi:hypothetical protein